MTEPLAWPAEMERPGFLRDLPCFGLYARIRCGFQRALSARSLDAVAAAWAPQGQERARLAGELAALIAEEMEWSSAAFLPGEPCAILFWDPSPDMSDVSAALAIEGRYGVEVPAELLREGVFEDLVALVSGA